MNGSEKQRYRAWAVPFYETALGEVALVDGKLFHLWHGDMCDRRSPERFERMAAFHFDPFEDIAIDDSGCWRWNTDKENMHQYVREYFASRREDG